MDDLETDRPKVWGLGYHGWATVFVVAMACAAALNISGLIQGSARLWIMFVPLVLVPPMWMAQTRLLARRGYASSAFARYNRRLALASFGYMVTFLAAVHIYDEYRPGVAATSGLALAVTLSVMAMLFAIFRYYREETDEYLRHRATTAALVGLALVLTIGAIWGFFETFGLLPRLWAWWVIPVWCIGLGVGNCWAGRQPE